MSRRGERDSGSRRTTGGSPTAGSAVRRHHPSNSELALLVEDAEWKRPSDGGRGASDDQPLAVELQQFGSGWGPDGGPLAVARVGSTTMRAWRVHRSFVIEIERGDEVARVSRVFCPPEPGVGPGLEFAIARLVSSLAIPPHSVVRLIGSVDDPPPRRASRARLARREIVSSWSVASGRWGGRYPGAGDEELVGVQPTDGAGIDEVLEGPMAEAVYRLLSSVQPVPAAVSISRQHRVTETWVGAGRGRLVQLVDGADAGSAEADDAPLDLAVDHHGHVVTGGTGWTCPVCAAVGCWECPTDELLAACTWCGGEACGTCRDADHAPVGDAPPCSFCGARDCGGCGRRAGAADCVVCDTTTCDGCRDHGLCPRCANLTVAAPGEVALLPAELHARGLVVATGSHRRSVVVAMSGTERQEVAVIRGGEVVDWWSLTPDVPAGGWLFPAYRASGDGNTVVVWAPIDDAAPGRTSRPHLAVDVDARAMLTWRCEDDRGRVVARSPAPIPVTTIRDQPSMFAALDAPPGAREGRRPSPAPRRSDEALARLVPSERPPVRHRLRVSRHSEAARVDVLGGGLRGFSVVSGEMAAHVAPWRTPHRGDRYLFAGWDPSPEVLCAASLDTAVAAVARFGSLVVVAVAVRYEPVRYHPLTETTGVLESIELGMSLGDGRRPVVVASAADPGSVEDIEIVDAVRIDRVVRPLPLAADGPPSRSATTAAVGYWPGAARPTMAVTEPVPADDVADAIFAAASTFGSIPEPRVVSVGVEVTETWQRPDGPVVIRRRVVPDSPHAVTDRPAPAIEPEPVRGTLEA